MLVKLYFLYKLDEIFLVLNLFPTELFIIKY